MLRTIHVNCTQRETEANGLSEFKVNLTLVALV